MSGNFRTSRRPSLRLSIRLSLISHCSLGSCIPGSHKDLTAVNGDPTCLDQLRPLPVDLDSSRPSLYFPLLILHKRFPMCLPAKGPEGFPLTAFRPHLWWRPVVKRPRWWKTGSRYHQSAVERQCVSAMSGSTGAEAQVCAWVSKQS